MGARTGLLKKTREEAETDLWRRLSSDDVSATGLPMTEGVREEIPAFRWRDLKLYDERARMVVKDDAIIRSGFRDVALSSKEVMGLWPKPSTRSVSLANAEVRCQERLEEQMRASPQVRTASKGTLRSNALNQIRGLSAIGFDRAWAAAVEATGARAWSHPGAPSKSLNHRDGNR